jgi:hypothetical protein
MTASARMATAVTTTGIPICASCAKVHRLKVHAAPKEQPPVKTRACAFCLLSREPVVSSTRPRSAGGASAEDQP